MQHIRVLTRHYSRLFEHSVHLYKPGLCNPALAMRRYTILRLTPRHLAIREMFHWHDSSTCARFSGVRSTVFASPDVVMNEHGNNTFHQAGSCLLHPEYGVFTTVQITQGGFTQGSWANTVGDTR